MAIIDIKVPDIGDFAEVGVIELLVQPGDTVTVDQSLITVESDKASMEIPSSHAGVVKSIAVKIGDKIAEGSVVLTLEAAEGAAQAAAPAAAPAPAAVVALPGGAAQLPAHPLQRLLYKRQQRLLLHLQPPATAALWIWTLMWSCSAVAPVATPQPSARLIWA